MHRQPARIWLDQADKFRVLAVIAGHGIEVHLDAVARSDHHIASFGRHSLAFREY
jgi:hypothetical protein